MSNEVELDLAVFRLKQAMQNKEAIKRYVNRNKASEEAWIRFGMKKPKKIVRVLGIMFLMFFASFENLAITEHNNLPPTQEVLR